MSLVGGLLQFLEEELKQRRIEIEEFSGCHAVRLLSQLIVISFFDLRRSKDSLNDGREKQRGTISDHPITRSEPANGQAKASFDMSNDIVGETLIAIERTNGVQSVDLFSPTVEEGSTNE